ncbi:MAG TPA: hypothetical protein VFW78_04555, partial [Bacteroidia bacterium]|nr:hypothetical protein [Bacteroidia bacterium]
MTLKRILFFITVLVVPSLAHSQTWQWFDRMGGAGYPTNISLPDEKIMDMVTDSAGNVYVCGRIVGQTNP